MSLHELQLQENAIDVALGQSSSRFVVLGRTGFTAYDYSITPKSVREPTLIGRKAVPEECGTPIQVSMRGEDEVYLLTHSAYANQDEIYSCRLHDGNWNRLDIEMDHIASIFPTQAYDNVYAQNGHGLISNISDKSSENSTTKFFGFCPWTELVEVGDEVRYKFSRILRVTTNMISKSLSAFLQVGACMLIPSCWLRIALRSLSHLHILSLQPRSIFSNSYT
jgi:hypothetical protein